MQEDGWIFEATGSTRFLNTLWKKIFCPVSAGSPTLSQFDDSDTPIQTLYYCITEAYPVLIHWRVVYAILLLCWSTACFFTLLRFTQHFYIAELYPILIHCWGIRYLNTLLSNFQTQIPCWAIPSPNTLLKYTLSYYIAKQFRNTNTLLSYNQS